MVVIKLNNQEYTAYKISKNTDEKTIIGYDENNKEIFKFNGVKDFSKFTLVKGNYSENIDNLEQRVTDLELIIAEKLGGNI